MSRRGLRVGVALRLVRESESHCASCASRSVGSSPRDPRVRHRHRRPARRPRSDAQRRQRPRDGRDRPRPSSPSSEESAAAGTDRCVYVPHHRDAARGAPDQACLDKAARRSVPAVSNLRALHRPRGRAGLPRPTRRPARGPSASTPRAGPSARGTAARRSRTASGGSRRL